MSECSDADLLKVFDRLPDLLKMAWDRRSSPRDDVYAIQDDVREAYRARRLAFKGSMPYRSLYTCPKCDHVSTVIRYELENPVAKGDDDARYHVSLRGRDIHEIRAHGGTFSDTCRTFLAYARECGIGSER